MSQTTDKPTLRRGDKGKHVQAMQFVLSWNGLYGIPDGDFGPKTERAVKDFQVLRGLKPDGIVGPATWAALDANAAKMAPAKPAEPPAMGLVDERSEKMIATLHPAIQNKARKFVQEAALQGITIKIISGLRSYEEQDALYAKGRTTQGNIVTKARAGYSNHNFGLAFDIGVFENGKYVPESPKYKQVAHVGKWLGFEWGGDWKTIKDEPHYQMRPVWARGMPESSMLAELRRRKQSGQDFLE